MGPSRAGSPGVPAAAHPGDRRDSQFSRALIRERCARRPQRADRTYSAACFFTQGGLPGWEPAGRYIEEVARAAGTRKPASGHEMEE